MIGIRLSIMMFIQFFIWGAWYVTAPRALTPLGFVPEDFGWTYSVGPIAGMISPFFVGMFADRFFATERVLGTMHLLGAVAMYLAVLLMGQNAAVLDVLKALNLTFVDGVNLCFFLHMLCYYPTLALTNSLAMQNMTDSAKQFPIIRVFGTIGWIVAGLTLTAFDWGDSISQFQLAAGASVLLSVYSFTLPHTPPPARGQAFRVSDALGLDAFVLLKKPSYLTFMVSSFLICIPLAFYYQMAERALVAGEVTDTEFKMTFGQMSEIIFMILMPFFFKRLGVKWMLFVGMLAWALRYGLFAIGTPEHITWMLIFGVTLHGICYDFFFVTGQIYTDQVAPEKIRTQAQGMLVLFTLGLGMFIGAQTAGQVEGYYTPEETKALDDQATAVDERIEKAGDSLSEEEKDELTAEAASLRKQALQKKNWQMIWAIPAIGAFVIMLAFTALFKEEPQPESEDADSVGDTAEDAGNQTPPEAGDS